MLVPIYYDNNTKIVQREHMPTPSETKYIQVLNEDRGSLYDLKYYRSLKVKKFYFNNQL